MLLLIAFTSHYDTLEHSKMFDWVWFLVSDSFYCRYPTLTIEHSTIWNFVLRVQQLSFVCEESQHEHFCVPTIFVLMSVFYVLLWWGSKYPTLTHEHLRKTIHLYVIVVTRFNEWGCISLLHSCCFIAIEWGWISLLLLMWNIWLCLWSTTLFTLYDFNIPLWHKINIIFGSVNMKITSIFGVLTHIVIFYIYPTLTHFWVFV